MDGIRVRGRDDKVTSPKEDQFDLPIKLDWWDIGAGISFNTDLLVPRTSPRAPAYLDNWNVAPLQTLDLMVRDLDRFFSGVERVVDLDFIQQYGKCFIGNSFLQA
ncbi:hypothetical protein Tco_0344665 [Tanacetum coccineum]